MAVAMANRRSCLSVAYEPNLLDDINRRLLNELQRDGRVAFAELGRRVGLSAPAVAERVGRLEREGVITGYRAEVDPKAIGYALAAVVRVRPFARQIHKIPEIAAQTPEIIECERITGEDCFLLRLHVRAMDDLEPVLDRFTPFGQTTTSIVHSAPVPRRALPLDVAV
jgi:Lrp/AsnC family transcriptional regulator, leucine-responsive regulatory protein